MGMIINPYVFGAPPAWMTVQTNTVNSDNTGWAGYTMRQVLAASRLTDASGSQIRFTLQAATSNPIAVTKMYVQLKGAGTYDFSTTPIQVLSGGSASFTVPTNSSLVTDGAAFTYTGTADIVVSIYTSGTTGYKMSQTSSGDTNWFKAGDDAATVGASGYSQTFNEYDVFPLVEAFV